MSKLTNILLSAILLVLLLNLIMTTAIFYELTDGTAKQADAVSVDIARQWGNTVTSLYNRQQDSLLYDLFHDEAKVKISAYQLEQQLKKLYEMFGKIEHISHISTTKLGEKADQEYYQFIFGARISDTDKKRAKVTLSLIKEKEKFMLYGFSINALQNLD